MDEQDKGLPGQEQAQAHEPSNTEESTKPKLPRERRTRAQMQFTPEKDLPGPREMPAPLKWQLETKQGRERYENDKRRFEMNLLAFRLYRKGLSEHKVNEVLQERYGMRLPSGAIWRLAKRAEEHNLGSGQRFGLWACVPNFRPLVPKKGKKEGGKRSAQHHLSRLFDEYPDIEASMVTFVVSRTTGKGEMAKVAKLDPDKVWNTFLGLLRQKNLHLAAPKRWPFNCAKRGYEAIRRWYQEERYRNPSRAARNELGAEVAKYLEADRRSIDRPALPTSVGMAYARVELDEHELDARFKFMLLDEEGNWYELPNGRMWILSVIECETENILATRAAFNKSFRKTDVLQLVHDCMWPPPAPEKLRLEHPEWRIVEGGHFPGELPAFAQCTWQELAMDRHSTHRAPDVVAAIKAVTGCEVTFDKPGEPRNRPLIEAFFKEMARLAQWLPSATGNKPDSPANRDPAGEKTENLIYVPLASEVLAVVARNLNARAKRSQGGLRPLESLHRLAAQGKAFISRVGEFGVDNRHLLLPQYSARLTRRHNRAFGPVIVNFGYVYYVGPELSRAEDLMAQEDLTVDIFPQEDARFAFVVPRSAPDRRYAVVVSHRLWRREPHTLEERKLWFALANQRCAADMSTMPHPGFALAQALAKTAVNNSAELAQMLGRVYTFIDRYSNGEVHPIGLTKEECAELLAYVEKNCPDGDEDEPQPPVKKSGEQCEESDSDLPGKWTPFDDDDDNYGLD